MPSYPMLKKKQDMISSEVQMVEDLVVALMVLILAI